MKILSGKPGFSKKQADLFFPPDFADDFPVSMQVTSVAHDYFLQLRGLMCKLCSRVVFVFCRYLRSMG